MKANKRLIALIITIILVFSFIYIKSNLSYWNMINSYKAYINSFGRTIMHLKAANKEINIDLDLLNDINYKPGKIIDVKNNITVNNTTIILDKFIYLEESNELYCGIIIKPRKGSKTQENINFYLECDEHILKERSISEQYGIGAIFQKTSFKSVDLSKCNGYSFIIEVDKVKTQIDINL